MATLTLHRALAELKLTDSKIEKKINNLKVVGYKKEEGLVNSKTELETFNTNAESQVDSIKALIKRKNLIKSAIVLANAQTQVEVAGVKMSISDAITKKANIYLEREFLSKLKADLRATEATIERHNATIDKDALELTKVTSGKEGDTSEQSKLIVEAFKKTNSISKVDPINVSELIEKLEEEISNFEMEVDAVLSEANAVTVIEIED